MIDFGWRLIASTTGTRSIRFSADQPPEHRGLENPEPDIEPDADHDDAEHERDAPAPDQELVAGDPAEHQHRDICQQQPGRRAELRPGRDEAAMGVRAAPIPSTAVPSRPIRRRRPIPWMKRMMVRMTAPQMPTLVVGRHKADGEGRRGRSAASVAINVALRPMRSPGGRRSSPTTGRARRNRALPDGECSSSTPHQRDSIYGEKSLPEDRGAVVVPQSSSPLGWSCPPCAGVIIGADAAGAP